MRSEKETIDTQNIIIRAQSGIISDLLSILSKYLTGEEMDSLPCVSRINNLAKIMGPIGKGAQK